MATRIIQPITKGNSVAKKDPAPKKKKCSDCGRLLDEKEFSLIETKGGEIRLSFCKDCERKGQEQATEDDKPIVEEEIKEELKKEEKKVEIVVEQPELSAEEEAKRLHEENVAKWGKGFDDDEYMILNTKLEQFTPYYPLKTAMHKEALMTYLKYAQLRDRAIINDDVDAADKWGKLAAKQAGDAKINPNQLSLADLSHGISNFGKITEAVEKATDIVSLLPKYIRAPRDEPDYYLWQTVNYLRRLTNMPEVEYADIYAFVNDKYKENHKTYEFLIKDENKKYKEPI